jgi:hypothetical protein
VLGAVQPIGPNDGSGAKGEFSSVKPVIPRFNVNAELTVEVLAETKAQVFDFSFSGK